MTNNDLIPRKEVEKMIENKIEINRDEVYMEGKETSRTSIEYEILQELIQELSQIESVNVWIPVVPSDIWSNEYAYVMVTDGVKIGPAYYDTHQGFFWHDNDLPVDPTLVKLDSFKHNLPPTNKV